MKKNANYLMLFTQVFIIVATIFLAAISCEHTRDSGEETLASLAIPSSVQINGDEIQWTGTDGNDCMIFGNVWERDNGEWNAIGLGVCQGTYNPSAGTCSNMQFIWSTTTVFNVYKVSADHGDDFIRYAHNWEWCEGTGDTEIRMDDGVVIEGQRNKIMLFWGDGDDDLIYTCDNPNSTCCYPGTRRADGRDENDVLYGGYFSDELWGDVGHDHLDGGSGNDVLHGGGGSDCIKGNNDTDTCYGDSGTDWIDGGKGLNDVCDCGSDGVYYASDCESHPNCTATAQYCTY